MNEEKGYWRRPSRRAVLRGVALSGAGITAVTMLGCQGQEKSPPVRPGAPAAKQPKRGGTLTLQGAAETGGLLFDPHVITSTQSITMRLFYQGLLGYNFRTYEVESELAQTWQQPSETEYVFLLHPGVKWHSKPPANSREMTATDIVFSLERARTNEPRFIARSLLANVDKIEAVDKATIRVTTKQPDAVTLSKVSSDNFLILAPEVAEKAGRFATPDTAVGTGAFIIKSAEDKVGGEFVRNPEYWKPGLPYLDSIRSKHFDSDQLGYAAFLGGQLDISKFVPGTEVKNYVARQGSNFVPDWYKDNTVSSITQPNTRVKPFDDPRVTRAMRLLIDHDEFKSGWAEVWFGRGQHGSVLCTALDGWDLSDEEYSKYPEWKQPKDDAAREALALLAAAGFTRDNPLKFEQAALDTDFAQAAAVLGQAQWKRLSQGVVDTTIKLFDNPTFQTVRAQRQFNYFIGVSAGDITEPDGWLTSLYKTGGSRNYPNLSDPKLDSMIDRQRAIFDLTQRKQAVREIILYMLDNSPVTIGSNRFFLNAVKPEVRNYAPEFSRQGRQYEQVWLDT